MDDKEKQGRERIAAELGRVAELGPMLKGTLSGIRRGAAKNGGGGRAAFLLTYKGEGNKTRSVYVPARRAAEVREMVDRHREAVQAINRVVELSVGLFKETREAASSKDTINP
jgi:hypothetical protein